MELIEHTVPFAKPPRLRALLEEYANEFGILAGQDEPIHAHYLWEIQEEGTTIGFIWVEQHELASQLWGSYVSRIIYPEFQEKKYGGRALSEVEAKLGERGISELFSQVNNCRPKSGLLARMSLLHRGYQVVRDKQYEIIPPEPGWSDEEYARKAAWPLVFRKSLVAP